MVKRRQVSDQIIWTRSGDHRSEGEALIAKNAKENGRLVGNPSVIVRKYPAGTFTVLAADSEWWNDEMKFHDEWTNRGSNASDFFDYLDGAGAPAHDA
jgi:hypothetical protein